MQLRSETANCVTIRGLNILFRVLTFAKPVCDNVLQSDPRSIEGCNTLIHEGFASVNTWKRLLYRHCYIPSFLDSSQVFTIQLKNNLSKFLARALTSINTRLQRASIPLKPAPDIFWCPFCLYRCSGYNHRTTFRNYSPRASTSINTRLLRASFPLKPAPDIVWCPFPLLHT